MAQPKLLSGRLIVTLDDGEDNIGRIISHNCLGNRALMIPREPWSASEPGEEAPPVPEEEYYDHIVFVKEMSDDIEIDGTSYAGMNFSAIIAVIPD